MMVNNYSLLNGDEQEELMSHYPIGSWSHSKLALFNRNEKAFERKHLWNDWSGKTRVSTIAGQAYHEALRVYFEEYGVIPRLNIIQLEKIAFDYVAKVRPNRWRVTKTLSTIEKCISEAHKIVSSLLKNFLTEIEVYAEHIDYIYTVESHINEWVCVNGVDIPLPLNAIADIVIRTKDGKNVIIDHKSLKTYTPDEERAMTGGKQAIIYVLAVEQKLGIEIDEVWFIENKYSMNKDKSPQLRAVKIEINKDSRRLYEAMVYQSLKRMLEAVNDPDYIYLVNDSDSFEDLGELYDFWMKTMIADVDDFNLSPAQKNHLEKRNKKIKDATLAGISPKAIIEFRKNAAAFITMDYSMENMTNSEKIEHLLRSFGYIVNVAYVQDGYASDTYLLQVNSGLKIKDINKYQLDIAAALGVSQVTIGSTLREHEDGRSYVAINVNKKRERDLLFDPSALVGRKIPIGRDNFEKLIVWDLDNHATPHVLCCGATGSGKSVSIKATIAFAELAGVTDIHIFDPKYEFCDLANSNIKVYNEIEKIESVMAELVRDMQNRTKNGDRHTTMIIFDEFADAIAQSRKGKALRGEKSLEDNMQMVAQKGRSLGFRILIAMQRASTKIINGDAKVNFPVQICFRVPKAIDSQVVLDEEGAEGLAGYGDGLINSPEYLGIQRFQGYYKP